MHGWALAMKNGVPSTGSVFEKLGPMVRVHSPSDGGI